LVQRLNTWSKQISGVLKKDLSIATYIVQFNR
jgi:hypothetical protein